MKMIKELETESGALGLGALGALVISGALVFGVGVAIGVDVDVALVFGVGVGALVAVVFGVALGLGSQNQRKSGRKRELEERKDENRQM